MSLCRLQSWSGSGNHEYPSAYWLPLGRVRRWFDRRPSRTLPRIEVHHQLLIHRHLYLVLRRQPAHRSRIVRFVKVQPPGNAPAVDPLKRSGNRYDGATSYLHGYDVALPHEKRRFVHLAIVHAKVPVIDQLARLIAGSGKAQSVDDVIKTALQHPEKIFTGNPFLTLGFCKHPSKLTFEDAIHSFQLLFFPELSAVLRGTRAGLSMLSWRECTPLHRALFCHAARTF